MYRSSFEYRECLGIEKVVRLERFPVFGNKCCGQIKKVSTVWDVEKVVKLERFPVFMS